jgi:predicted ribosomally synthesized peptide with nif11-like leader
MSVANIKAFSEKSRSDQALAEALKACLKIKDLRALAKDNGFEFDEDSLYPPNSPQFTNDQLSERLCKAILAV